MDFATPSSNHDFAFTDCNLGNAVFPYSADPQESEFNGFNYTTFSIPIKGNLNPSNLGDLSNFFESKDTPKAYQGTSKIVVRFWNTATGDLFSNLTDTNNDPLLMFVHSSYNQLQIANDKQQRQDTYIFSSSATLDGRQLSTLEEELPLELTATISKVPNLIQDTVGTMVELSANYELSFTVLPIAISGRPSGIMKFTDRATKKLHLISIEMDSVTSRLLVQFSTTFDNRTKTERFLQPALPMYQTTRIKLRALFTTIDVFYNQTLVQSNTLSGQRFSGPALRFISQQEVKPAIARLSSVSMIDMADSKVHTTTNRLGPIMTYTKTFVPENYSLSFEIKPTGISPNWTNILQYTKDGGNFGLGSRIPCNCLSVYVF